MVGRNAGLPPERRIEFRVGIHLGDVVEESDGDLMGDPPRSGAVGAARTSALRPLFDPTIALHHGRVVKRTGDGAPGGLGCVMRHRSRCCGSWDHPSSPMAAVGLQVRSVLAIQA